MPEVPDSQAPSREEVLLSEEETQRQEQAEVEQSLPEGESLYKANEVYMFSSPNGVGYSLQIVSVGQEKWQIINVSEGGEPAEMPADQAEALFATGRKQ